MSAASRAGNWPGCFATALLVARAISSQSWLCLLLCYRRCKAIFKCYKAFHRLGLLTCPKLWQKQSDVWCVQVHSSDMPEIWNMLKIVTLATVIAVCSAAAVIILLVIGSPTIVNGYADCSNMLIATSELRASHRSAFFRQVVCNV